MRRVQVRRFHQIFVQCLVRFDFAVRYIGVRAADGSVEHQADAMALSMLVFRWSVRRGGGESLLRAWDESLFSQAEQRQLCTACGLPDEACEPTALELETRLRQCQALGDERFEALEEACSQETEAQQAQCILSGCLNA